MNTIFKKIGTIFGEKMINHIGKSFSDDNGNPSNMRLMTSFVILVVLFNWTYFNITNGTIASFGTQDLMMVLGPLLGKAYQKGHEVKVTNGGKE